jgi:TPR repeat protein
MNKIIGDNDSVMLRYKPIVLGITIGLTLFCSGLSHADIKGGQAAIIRGDFATAFKEFKEDADKGVMHAQAAVAVMLHIGQGVKRDLAKAFSWYLKAAEQGYAAGQANVGMMYYKGAGTQQDDVQAYAWLDLASHTRGGREHNAKARVESYLTPKQLNEAEELAIEYRKKYLKK